MKVTLSKDQVYDEDGQFSTLIKSMFITNSLTHVREKNDTYITIELTEKEIDRYCSSKVKRGKKLKKGNKTSDFDFWNLYWGVFQEVQEEIEEFPLSGVKEFNAWIYADVKILTEVIPEGLPYRDITDEEGNITGQRTWGQWANYTSNSGVRISNDNTKCVLRTDVGGNNRTMSEMYLIKLYLDSKKKLNGLLQNSIEVKDILKQPLFSIQP